MSNAEIAANIAKEITVAVTDKLGSEAQAKRLTMAEHTKEFFETIYDAVLLKLND